MTTRSYSRLLWGLLLLGLGGLLLLQNLNILPVWNNFWGVIWAGAFGVAGLIFLVVFLQDRMQWWAVIPGLTLIGIGLIIGLSALFPEGVGGWIGGVFLAMIGLAFWIVYLTNRDYWWAIIPAGTLVTLGVVAGATAIWGGVELGGLFFVGLGLTFLLVAIVPTPQGQMKWAYIPAVVLLSMGALIWLAATSLIQYLWPLALIVAGGYLLWRAYSHRRI
jgi:hypothetical protein